MPALHHEIRVKKEVTRTAKHNSYKVIIPYKIAQQMSLKDGMILYGMTKNNKLCISEKNTAESTPITVRQIRTKTYKEMPYYCTKITIPIQFIRELDIAKCRQIDIENTDKTLTIKPIKS